MTSEYSLDIRQVIFVNAIAKRAFDELPETVRLAAEVAISAPQNNRPLPRGRYTQLTGALSGITELRLAHDDNAYRIYELMEFAEVIYILDAGLKKSHSGKEIPRPQVQTLEIRKTAAREHYQAHVERFRAEFEIRKANRQSAGTPSKTGEA